MGDLESPQQNAAHYVALFNVLLRDKQWMLSITSMGGILAGVTREVEKSPMHKCTFINHKESSEYQMAGKYSYEVKGKNTERQIVSPLILKCFGLVLRIFAV